jgi:lipopolysaccharide export system permease protein
MPLFERYILKRATHAFILTALALIGTLWIVRLLRSLDVVTAQGQAIWLFLVVTVLAMPPFVQVVAPIAFLVAVIVTLNRANNDSELPVIAGAGASRLAVNRPILVLATVITLAAILSHHVVSPASLATLRTITSRIQATMIATFVQAGGFQTLQRGFTIHIRERAPDGSFHDVFISDERNPDESLQYIAAQGMLMNELGGSFLLLQNGDIIREDRVKREHTVVAFDTYALDLSQIAGGGGSVRYRAAERSTVYLLDPPADDKVLKEHPERVQAEIRDRITAPLYAIMFALISLAFLGRPRSNRQNRGLAITAAVGICLLLRAGGFAAVQAARGSNTATLLTYLLPIAGIAFGAYATIRDAHLRLPPAVEGAVDRAVGAALHLLRRGPQASVAGDQP